MIKIVLIIFITILANNCYYGQYINENKELDKALQNGNVIFIKKTECFLNHGPASFKMNDSIILFHDSIIIKIYEIRNANIFINNKVDSSLCGLKDTFYENIEGKWECSGKVIKCKGKRIQNWTLNVKDKQNKINLIKGNNVDTDYRTSFFIENLDTIFQFFSDLPEPPWQPNICKEYWINAINIK
jgi:hypothetical protein